jgi:probable phosphoglycerate mutase
MPAFTTLYLIRHGETYHNARQQPPPGKAPEDLCPRGEEQAQHLAVEVARLLGGRRPRLYCSDQRRALDTLEPIRRHHGTAPAEVVTARAYAEFYRGELGVAVPDWTAWLAEHARQRALWVEQTGGHPDDFKLQGGTSPNEERQHTRAVAAALARQHPDEAVVLVAHGGFNEIMLRELLGLPQAPAQHNACINLLTLDGGGRLVFENVLLNHVAYLPQHLRPWEWFSDNRHPGTA